MTKRQINWNWYSKYEEPFIYPFESKKTNPLYLDFNPSSNIDIPS